MLNAESPLKYQSSLRKLNQPQSTEGSSLPKLSILSSPTNQSGKYENFQLNDRNTPMKRSFSMSAVLHGDNLSPTLQRFRRNHDGANKEDRERQRQTQINKLMQRRNLQIKREDDHKKKQQENLRQLIQKNSRILEGYHQGTIRSNTFNNSLPINPITKKYQDNLRGLNQKQVDNEQKVRKLIRGHRMQSMGTSGFNLINGAPIDNTSKLLAHNKDIEGMFGERIQKFNEKLKLRPQSLEQFESLSASKKFKYH